MVLRNYITISLVALLIASCNTGGKATSVQGEAPAVVYADPTSLYLRNCESCHGMDGTKGVSNAANLQKSIMTNAQLKNVIENGNSKGMMPYKDIITSEVEMNSLMEYVKAMRR